MEAETRGWGIHWGLVAEDPDEWGEALEEAQRRGWGSVRSPYCQIWRERGQWTAGGRWAWDWACPAASALASLC